MYPFTIYLLVSLVCLHNVTSKVYVIDLTDKKTDHDEIIKLRDMLPFLKIEENKQLIERIDRKLKTVDNDDCLDITTKTQKLKCLEKYPRNDKSVARAYVPRYYREFYTQRPKRTIYSLYNYYGGLLKTKPFTDLTRDEFSQDYLDIGDLSRAEPQCYYPECLKSRLQKKDYITDLFRRPIVRRNAQNPVFVEKRTSLDSDSSESSESDMSDRNVRKRKPNRFQVVFNEDSSLESEEERKLQKSLSSESEEHKQESNSDSESVEVTEKPRRSDKFSYLQGNKLYDSFRRRLEHFLPKRFHWDDDDIHHLGYYWFDGPRGKYS